MKNNLMDNVLEIKREVIKHDNFKFYIEEPTPNDLDHAVKMENFSIITTISFQEWIGLGDSASKPNRKIEITEGPYCFYDYISIYGQYKPTAQEYISYFERGLSPACMKYNYSPIEAKGFLRIITKQEY